MRRSIITAAFLIVLFALPLCAQRRGFSSPRMGASAGVRPGGRIIVRGGFGFGHNPRFNVFFGRRFHHRRFFSPFGFPFTVPIYPYYPFGYQSDFVYSNYPAQPAYAAETGAVSVSDLDRLQAELDDIRQQQAVLIQQAQLAPQRSAPAATPAREAPAPLTVLVFRDGRRLEVRNYAIAGKTLWIFSEERARKVPLADLDLDATRKANEERGVEFPARG